MRLQIFLSMTMLSQQEGFVPRYYWRLRSSNNRIIAIGGEPFASAYNAKRSFNRLWTRLRRSDYPKVEVIR